MNHASGTAVASKGDNGIVAVPGWKRALDIVCIALALPVMLLPTLLIALLIKMVSTGPVLFRQERIGFRGQPFQLLKFRTMHVDADNDLHRAHSDGFISSNSPMVKMDVHGDERVIPFGLLLRTSGLDELPQLINVVRGEMSLVGPRPCIRYEYDRYLPWHKERFNALPGLTGLWQVSGKNKTTFNEMINLDIQYARRQAFWFDVGIMARTLPALVIQVHDTYQAKRRRVGKPSPVQGRMVAKSPGKETEHRFAMVSSESLMKTSREEYK